MKTWEIGVGSITPRDGDDVRWTGKTVEVISENEALALATDGGYYRNARVRPSISIEILEVSVGKYRATLPNGRTMTFSATRTTGGA